MSRGKIELLLVKYILDEITDPERELLDHWIKESVDHQKFFEQLINDNSFKTQYEIYARINEQKAWKSFEQNRIKRYRINYPSILRYAAMLLLPILILGLGWYYYSFTPNENSDDCFVISSNSSPILPGISKATLSSGHQKKVLQSADVTVNIGSSTVLAQAGKLVYPPAPAIIKNEKPAVEKVEPANRNNTLTTDQGNEFRVVFEDGTEVHLNYDTELRYPVKFGKSKRMVYLKGEAYFKIAKDTRPFYVMTDNGTVKQYGTEFNVNTFAPGRTEVVLVRGSISVIPKDGGEEKHLAPGQIAYATKDNDISIHDVDVVPYVAWNEGRLIFENKSLAYIMKILERWYSVDVAFNSEEIKQLHFTGNMDRYGTITPILNAIARTTNLKINIQGKKILITAN